MKKLLIYVTDLLGQMHAIFFKKNYKISVK